MTTHKKKVLVVDDEVQFTRLLKLSLEQSNRYVVQVENRPLAAVARAEQFLPDVILLDVMMPDLDGGTLAAQFQTHAKLKDVPIVFVTAAARKAEVSSAGGQIGGLRFLAKPVGLPEVMTCLERCLGA